MKMVKVFLIIVIIASLLVGCAKKVEETPVANENNIEFPQEVLDLAKNFVVDLLSERYDRVVAADMDVKMQVMFTEKLAKDIYTELITKCGYFDRVEELQTSIEGDYGVVTVICKFDLIYVNMKVMIDNDMKIAGFTYTFNKEYKAKEINESEVAFGIEFQIHGALTEPKSDSDLPLVIIVGGSGPIDRNGVIGASTPYYDIARALYEEGIAVLRYDKRTLTYRQYYSNNIDGLTLWDETIDDATMAFYYAQTLEGIDKNRIYLLGHSLGGYSMGRIAKMTNEEAAGYILLAPNALPLEDGILKQLKYLEKYDGVITDDEKARYEQYEKQRDNIKALTEDSILQPNELLNAPKSYWLDLKDYDPIESIKDVKAPILIMQGERDYQVDMDEYQKWHNGLKNKDNVEFITFKDLNHLFIYGEGHSHPEEYSYANSVSNKAIEAIVTFVKEH